MIQLGIARGIRNERIGRTRTPSLPILLFAVVVFGCTCKGPHAAAADPPSSPSASPAPCTPSAGRVVPGDPGRAEVRLRVDTSADVHPISPYVYGTNVTDAWKGKARHLAFARAGGNRWSAYDWENNASNAGSDWKHQNDGLLGGGDTPGAALRDRIVAAHAAGASILVTLPLLDRVAADKGKDGDVAKTPDYLHRRFVRNLPSKGAPFAYPPNRSDGVVYQDELVAWLEKTFPKADVDPDRRIFFSLDNEPALWPSTHPRVHPKATTYDELVTRSIALARAVKTVDPNALVFGPASYGWMGMANLQRAPDGDGRFFLAYYLDAFRAASAQAGHRLLDVLDVHWYPEVRAGGVRVTLPDSRPDVVAARMQSTRSLWDPSYDEHTWISRAGTHGPIELIPRLARLVQAHFPGTRLAITEYFFGGGRDVSGAVAQADALGIFGREGLFAAAVWTADRPDAWIYPAFAMFRSYDGHGGRFGDTSVRATTSDLDRVTVYAAVDAKRPARVTVIAINKTTRPTGISLAVAAPACVSRAQVYRLTSARPAPVEGASLAAVAANAFRDELPPMSVTTYVLEP